MASFKHQLDSSMGCSPRHSDSTTKPAQFLDIPVEIRLKIYRHCIPHNDIFHIGAPRTRPKVYDNGFRGAFLGFRRRECRDPGWGWMPSLDPGNLIDHWPKINATHKNGILCVSKTVSEEALDVLYGENIFELDLIHYESCVPFETLPKNLMMRIKKLRIIVHATEKISYSKWILNQSLWAKIFEDLNNLYFEVQTIEWSEEWYVQLKTWTSYRQEWHDSAWCSEITSCFKYLQGCEVMLKVEQIPGRRFGDFIEQRLPKGYRKIEGDIVGNGIFRWKPDNLESKSVLGTPPSADDLCSFSHMYEETQVGL